MSQEPDRRLHRVSLLFTVGARIKELLLPLLFAIFATRSDEAQLVIGALIALVAGVSAVWEYFSYSYRYDEDDLVVRTGLFFRNERHIPYDRIQNIDAVQNVAHRFFNVAVVHVQTGAGAAPEATLKVLAMRDLAEMRQRVVAERRVVAATSNDVAPALSADQVVAAAPVRLLHIPPEELMLAGFIENRGLALIAATMAGLWQIDPVEKLISQRLPEMAPEWTRRAAEAGVTANGTMIVVGITTLFLVAVVFIRLLSTVWALIRLYDFTLTRDGNDLRAEFGLFTRVTATIPLRRVQTVSIHQRWLHRKLGRAAIRVTTAGGSGIPGQEERSDREWLAPIIGTADVRSLIQHVDPSLELEGIDWTRAHPRAGRRLLRVSAAWVAAIAGASAFVIGWWSIGVAAVMGIVAVMRAEGIANNLGSAIVGERVAFRTGWLHRVVSVVRFERIQSALCHQSPFDRRAGMARVGVDTAGMGQGELSMPYLPQATALQLHARLAQAAVQTPFTWS